METNIEVAMRRTDWALLAKEKLELIRALNAAPLVDQMYGRDNDLLGGILNWIDALQDAAERDGYPVVFLED